jgi:tetratricopeptide (TPR) repeat protein
LTTILAILVPFAAAQETDSEPDPASIAIEHFNQGQDKHEKADYDGAIASYSAALKAVPEFPEAEYQRAVAYVALGRVADAETGFRRAVELRDDWTLGLAGLGSVLVRNGKFDEAETVLHKAIKLDELNIPAFVALTDLKLERDAPAGELKQLLSTIARLTGKANPTSSLWTARAKLERALGDVTGAGTSIRSALRIDPKDTSALFQGAAAALAASDPDNAETFLGRYLSAGGSEAAIIGLRAQLLLRRGQPREAIKLLDSVPEPTPELADLRERIMIWISAGPEELEKRLIHGEAFAPEILGRLCTLYRRSDPEKALNYCRKAYEADNRIDHAIGFGAALVQAKLYNDAVVLLRQIAGTAPDNATIRANIATALFQLKRYEEAKSEFRWLIDRRPDLVAGYYFLAVSHDHLGEYLDAMANYQEFLRRADPVKNNDDIDRVTLRLPSLQKQINSKQGKRNE